jgi:excinuclease ABC subunit C
VNVGFQLDRRLAFEPEDSDALLRSIPAAPGVFALRGADAANGAPSEPYLSRTADLRRRLRRLLAPPEISAADGQPVLSRRLNLRNRVRFLEYTRTGSDFESTLLLYHASCAAFGPAEARRRLRLHPPFFLRLTLSREHPRVYITNRPSNRALAEFFGPFPSRAAAERYADAVLDLFQLRRCHEDLQPFPDHPGCVYGEMNKCLRPCKGGAPDGDRDGKPANPLACTPAQYAAEAGRVHAFLRTRGQSLLDETAAQRDAASAALDFEAAAALHKHWEKVRAAALLADELVRPLPQLRAVMIQPAAPPAPTELKTNASAEPRYESGSGSFQIEVDHSAGEAALFLLAHGRLAGPERLSTLGVRAVREQTAVGSSLFAQPLMLAPIPLDEPSATPFIDLATQPLAPEPNPGAPSSPTVISSAKVGEPDAPEPALSLPKEPALSLPKGSASGTLASTEAPAASLSPEDRARQVLARLAEAASAAPAPTLDELCDALSLFRRWYYRPEKQRTGAVYHPQAAPDLSTDTDAAWPIRRILNGAARIVLGPPAAAPPVDREAYKDLAQPKDLKTRVIHPGRADVERTVPVLPRRKRSRSAPLSPAE